ncbi:hypothetical protein OPT61_g83 [Boeremia exigua]|uniref:Uncharacterized protein n=1 Tax=Boeremia exigua TaxID=749465 RepID=A0ACC2IUZ3_9PLEO|nr:hypothetical protein OPT61_g83 [Boeremia exigua]
MIAEQAMTFPILSELRNLLILTIHPGEIRIQLGQLLHKLRLRAAHRLHLKQPIHLIKRHTLRLRDKEPHKHHRAGTHRPEEEIHPEPIAPHTSHHIRRNTRDDKRPQPVRHGRAHLPDITGGLVEHLGVDDPGRAVPRCNVHARPQVDHEDGGDALAGEAGTLGGGGLGHDECADDDHADCAEGAAEEEERAAAEFVDHDVLVLLELMVYVGVLTYNSVDAGEVLEQEEHVAQEQAPQHRVVGQRQTDGLDESSGQVIDLEIHHLNLLEDVGVVGLELPVPAEVGNALLAPALGPQPAGCLPEEEQTADEDHAGRDELHGEGNEPLVATVCDALGHAEVDPEADEAANLPAQFVGSDKTSSNSWGCNLRDEDGDLKSTNAESRDEPASIHRTQMSADGSEGNADTNDEHGNESPERDPPSKVVGRAVGEDGPEEGARLEQRDNIGLDQAPLRLDHVRKPKLVLKSLQRDRRPNKRRRVPNHTRRKRRRHGRHIDAPVIHVLRRRPVFNHKRKMQKARQPVKAAVMSLPNPPDRTDFSGAPQRSIQNVERLGVSIRPPRRAAAPPSTVLPGGEHSAQASVEECASPCGGPRMRAAILHGRGAANQCREFQRQSDDEVGPARERF